VEADAERNLDAFVPPPLNPKLTLHHAAAMAGARRRLCAVCLRTPHIVSAVSSYIAGDSSSDRREDTQPARSRAIRPAPCAPGRAATPVVAMGFSVHRRKKASFVRLLLATFRNPFPRTSTPHTWPHGSPVFNQRPCGLDWWQINSSWPLFLLFLLQFMGHWCARELFRGIAIVNV
jgi:hypothetical protein